MLSRHEDCKSAMQALSPKLLLARRFARSREGAAAIEFAILALPYFLVVFAIIETFLAMMGEQLVTNATDRLARQLRTGQISSTISQEDFRKLFCAEVSILITCSTDEIKKPEKLYIDLRSFNTFADIPKTIPLTPNGQFSISIRPHSSFHRVGQAPSICCVSITVGRWWPISCGLI